MRLGEEIEVEIETGKTLIVKLISVGQPQADGNRIVYFELNGQPREVLIKDESVKATVQAKVKGDPKNPNHISATMPGTVVKLVVEKGEKVEKGDHLNYYRSHENGNDCSSSILRSCERYLCSEW